MGDGTKANISKDRIKIVVDIMSFRGSNVTVNFIIGNIGIQAREAADSRIGSFGHVIFLNVPTNRRKNGMPFLLLTDGILILPTSLYYILFKSLLLWDEIKAKNTNDTNGDVGIKDIAVLIKRRKVDAAVFGYSNTFLLNVIFNIDIIGTNILRMRRIKGILYVHKMTLSLV